MIKSFLTNIAQSKRVYQREYISNIIHTRVTERMKELRMIGIYDDKMILMSVYSYCNDKMIQLADHSKYKRYKIIFTTSEHTH